MSKFNFAMSTMYNLHLADLGKKLINKSSLILQSNSKIYKEMYDCRTRQYIIYLKLSYLKILFFIILTHSSTVFSFS